VTEWRERAGPEARKVLDTYRQQRAR